MAFPPLPSMRVMTPSPKRACRTRCPVERTRFTGAAAGTGAGALSSRAMPVSRIAPAFGEVGGHLLGVAGQAAAQLLGAIAGGGKHRHALALLLGRTSALRQVPAGTRERADQPVHLFDDLLGGVEGDQLHAVQPAQFGADTVAFLGVHQFHIALAALPFGRQPDEADGDACLGVELVELQAAIGGRVDQPVGADIVLLGKAFKGAGQDFAPRTHGDVDVVHDRASPMVCRFVPAPHIRAAVRHCSTSVPCG